MRAARAEGNPSLVMGLHTVDVRDMQYHQRAFRILETRLDSDGCFATKLREQEERLSQSNLHHGDERGVKVHKVNG